MIRGEELTDMDEEAETKAIGRICPDDRCKRENAAELGTRPKKTAWAGQSTFKNIRRESKGGR